MNAVSPAAIDNETRRAQRDEANLTRSRHRRPSQDRDGDAGRCQHLPALGERVRFRRKSIPKIIITSLGRPPLGTMGNVIDEALAAQEDDEAVQVEEGEAGAHRPLYDKTGLLEKARGLRREVLPVADVASKADIRPPGTVTMSLQPGAR